MDIQGEKKEFLNGYALVVKTEEDKDEIVHYVRGLCEEILLSKKKIKVIVATS